MWLNKDGMRVRRERIIEVAFQLFCERGIGRGSMGEIAEQSGVGRRTIYRYFDNKMYLLMDVPAYQWEILMGDIRKDIDFYATYPSPTGREQMAVRLDAFPQICENSAPLLLFSCGIQRNRRRSRARFPYEQMDFFAYDIRGSCVDVLKKAGRTARCPFLMTERRSLAHRMMRRK